MSLRQKTLFIIGTTLVALLGVLYAASSSILLKSLKNAEEQNTRQLVRGVLSGFEQIQDDFSTRFIDWSAWDDTYAFVEDRNTNYIQSNLVPETLENLNVNLVVYVHPSGRIVFGTGFDSKSQKKIPIPATIRKHLSLKDALLQHADPKSRLTGLLLLPEGPMLITSLPIITSRKTGPIRGTLIFGRYLDANQIKQLSKITRTRLTLYGLNHPQIPTDFQRVRLALFGDQKLVTPGSSHRSSPVLVRLLDDNTIAGYTWLPDIYGQPALLLRVDSDRKIYQQSRSSRRYLIASLVLVGMVFGGITLLLLERLVLSRLAGLSTDVKRIGAKSDLSLRVFSKGRDELSSLADSINGMLSTLEEAQRQQRESEERYRAIIEQASEGIFLFDADNLRILEANTAFEQLLGYPTTEMLELTLYDIVVQDGAEDSTVRATSPTGEGDRDDVTRTIEQIFQQQHLTLGERRYYRRDGSLVDVDVSISLITYGGRKVFCAVVHDITERKQAEESLRQAEEKYRQIFENATEGIFQIAPDGRFISANPALANIYGYSSVDELKADLIDFGQQLYLDPSRHTRFLATVQKHAGVSRLVSQIHRKDGKTIWIAEYTRAVRDDSGALLYYEGTVEDITDRKITEEAWRYQQEQSENLLLNILPGPIAARLKLQESTIADSFAEVTVMFADIVDFTQISAEIPPTELVSLLNKIFSAFDNLADKHGLEKIKTIGDAYMVVGGLPMPRSDHAEAIAEMALDMQQVITQFNTDNGQSLNIRIGISTGPVVAGVIGIKRIIYDLWGDTVNTASRMESHGIAGRIQITASTYERLRGKYKLKKRGVIQVKGKGEMMTYLLTGRLSQHQPIYAADSRLVL